MPKEKPQNPHNQKPPDFCGICNEQNFWISVFGGEWRCLACDKPPFDGMIAQTHKTGDWSYWDVMDAEDEAWLARPRYNANQSFYGDFNSPVMSYGKYKGEPVVKIGRIDRKYLKWIWDTENETVEVMLEIGRLLGFKSRGAEREPFT